jgi:YidC/Oxa1 family membrane protein insertase
MGPVSKLLGLIFNAIYTLFNGMGVESIALSIVVFTILIRLILFPFTLKQTRSSKIQTYLRPEFNKITKKYKGKKDQESMLAQQKETRELQEKYGIKMTQGCLTSILQFPIFIGLYNVIQNIPAYVPKVKAMYEPIATEIMKTDKGYNIMTQFVEDNKVTRIASKLTEFATSTDATSGEGLKSFNSVIDILYRCNDDLLTKLTDVFSANPEVGRLIGESKSQIEAINHFIFGINLSEEPGFKLSPALIIPIAAFICQFLSMLVVPMNETGDPQQDAQMKSMRRSMYFMPFMSLFITIKAPAGLGIYWAVSALMGFLITVGINFYYDHIDMEALVEKQKAKAAKDIEKRKASGKKSFSERLTESMMGQTEEEEAKETNKSMNKFGNMNLKNFESEVDNSNDTDDADSSDDASDNSSASAPKKGSLADKANAVKRFNDTGVK